jgi:hypothetical protein
MNGTYILKSSGFSFALLALIRLMIRFMQIQLKKVKMEIKPIKSESDYQNALIMLDELFDSATGTPESDYADVLALLVDEYEKSESLLLR